MHGNKASNVAGAMVALACMLVCMLCYKGTTMAKHIVTGTTVTNTATNTVKQLPAATSTVALAPHAHSKPTAPSGVPASAWQVVGTPSTAKRAIAGVGPVPAPGSVGLAALQAIAAGGKQGATWQAVQAAVAACNTVKPHKLMPLLTWLAKNRGYSFAYTGGASGNGYLTCTNLPSL